MNSATAERCIETIGRKDATPDELKQAASVLESEAAKLKPGEFREAFLTLSSKAYSSIGEAESASRASALAKESHQTAIDREKAASSPRCPCSAKWSPPSPAWHR